MRPGCLRCWLGAIDSIDFASLFHAISSKEHSAQYKQASDYECTDIHNSYSLLKCIISTPCVTTESRCHSGTEWLLECATGGVQCGFLVYSHIRNAAAECSSSKFQYRN